MSSAAPGTHLSTWSVMNRSTDRAFREISNSIASACFCSSCGGASTDSGFQAPFPRSYEEAACWLHISNHGLGRKPKPCETNSGSHLDCSSAACLPEQGQECLQPAVARPSSPCPLQATGGVPVVSGVPPPGSRQSQTAALPPWHHLVARQRHARLQERGAASSRGRGGESWPRHGSSPDLTLFWGCLSPPARLGPAEYVPVANPAHSYATRPPVSEDTTSVLHVPRLAA